MILAIVSDDAVYSVDCDPDRDRAYSEILDCAFHLLMAFDVTDPSFGFAELCGELIVPHFSDNGIAYYWANQLIGTESVTWIGE